MTTATVDRTAPDQTTENQDQPGRWATWRARRAAERAARQVARSTTPAAPVDRRPVQTTPRPPTIAGVGDWSRDIEQRAVALAAGMIADRVDPAQVAALARPLVRRRSKAERTTGRTTSRSRLLLVVPLVLVNLTALSGQIGWSMDHLGSADWLDVIPHGQAFRALGFSLSVESVGIYLSYEAHAALLARVAALKLRLSAYLVGAAAGAMNYSHYAADWAPNTRAIVFGLLSLGSPILWTIWSMARSRRQLVEDGVVDARSARFSTAKRLLFSYRSFGAMRYAVDHGITAEREAWEDYRQYRADRRADRALRRADRRHAAQAARADRPVQDQTPGRLRAWLVRRLGGAVPAAQGQERTDTDRTERDQDQTDEGQDQTEQDQTTAPAGPPPGHEDRVRALLNRYTGVIPARRTVQADMRPTGPGWSSAGLVQAAINDARARRAAA